ncbi:hypothetical protein HZS_681 [Henneguya salminicola]|nr:hypothetical protein HZS_681 [Henneguya salminicola]
MPNGKDWINAHGTRCAGEIGAQANNNICGVGVAYNSKIGGIKLLSIEMNDSFEAKALSFQNNYIDIYSNSWGPKDDGKSYGKPGELSEEALKRGVTYGRNGKGCIYVWATGNGGLMDDDCNCDGYVTSIYTISIGSISDHGLSVFYKESCSSTLAVTFSGGSHREKEENKIITTDVNGECTDHFRGTSSAAPIAAGIIALGLEANPLLTWRDIQHLIVHSVTVTSPLDKGWIINGVGHHFNHKFGFGKLDAYNFVNLAKKWKTVSTQKICQGFKMTSELILEKYSSIELHFPTDGCISKPEEHITKLEHVILRVSYEAPIRGSITIGIISPMNTFSQILSKRKRDIEENSIENWDYMSVFNWDESPMGVWIINIKDVSKSFINNETKSLNSSHLQPDEEDLTKHVCKINNSKIMDDNNSNQKPNNTKKSSILFLKKLKRHAENINTLNINTEKKIKFTQIELIFYGT